MKTLLFLVLFAGLFSLQSCLHFEAAFPEVTVFLPVDLDYLNGEIYCSALSGQVYSFPNSDTATPSVFFDLFQSTSPGVQFYTNLFEGGQDGLSSIEFHPNYPSIPKFYAYHAATPNTIQVTAWRVSGGQVDYANGEVLLDFQRNPRFDEVRVGGDMKFDGKGNLYISVGDTANSTASQDPNTFLGKILRITPSARGTGYSIPSSNPYTHHTQCGKSEVFAIGVRNPRKMLFPTLNSQLLVGDLGETFDEINVVEAGDNCGWDYIDGCSDIVPSLPRGRYRYPSYQYTFAPNIQSMTLGVIYPRTPQINEFSVLTGQILYADLYSGQLFAVPWKTVKEGECVTGTASFVAQGPPCSAMVLAGDTLIVADPFGAFYGNPTFARLVAN